MQRHDRGNDLLDLQDVPTKTLIVMNKIKVVHTKFQFAIGALAEGEWFCKLAAQQSDCFNKVGPRLNFPISRDAAGVLIVEQIKAGQFVHLNAVIQDGVGLAAKNFD